MRIERATPVLPGPDLAAQQAFWTQVVGFTTTGEHPGFVTMELDGLPVFLSEAPAEVAANTLLWLEVDDVEGWRERLLQAGVSPRYRDKSGPGVTRISAEAWGRDFALRDPAGNCVHFFSP